MTEPIKTLAIRISLILLLAVLILGLAVSSALAENTSGVPVPRVPSFTSGDAAARGLAIARHAESYDSGWLDEYSQARMTLYDARGGTTQREIRQMLLEREDGDKSLLRFMTPADIRGVAALIHEHPSATDDTWLYLPATRRVRRIAGANRTASFQGTEFTYEDLAGYEVSRYRWRYLGDDTLTVDGRRERIYRLEARPTYDDTGYSRLVATVNQESFRTSRIEFFDLSGERLKTLTASRWRTHHGRFHRPRRLDMQNHQTGKRTVIDFTAQFVMLSHYQRRDGSARPNLTDAQFTRRALEGG